MTIQDFINSYTNPEKTIAVSGNNHYQGELVQGIKDNIPKGFIIAKGWSNEKRGEVFLNKMEHTVITISYLGVNVITYRNSQAYSEAIKYASDFHKIR